MNNRDLLNEYRATLTALRYLEQQLNQCSADSGLQGPASRQVREALQQQRHTLSARLQAMAESVTAIIRRADARTILVLNYYYLMACTDQQAAQALGLSREHVCRLRNAFVRGL